MAFIYSKQVTCLSVSTDGCQLLSGSHDTTVKLWDIPSRQCLRTLQHKGYCKIKVLTDDLIEKLCIKKHKESKSI